MNFQVFFILLINIFYVCSSPYFNNLLNERRRFCGSHLTSVLSLVCQGKYQSPTNVKKSYEHDLSNSEYEGDYDETVDSEMDFPFLSKALARSLIPQKPRRQVVSECCYKSCTIKELQAYCGK